MFGLLGIVQSAFADEAYNQALVPPLADDDVSSRDVFGEGHVIESVEVCETKNVHAEEKMIVSGEADEDVNSQDII